MYNSATLVEIATKRKYLEEDIACLYESFAIILPLPSHLNLLSVVVIDVNVSTRKYDTSTCFYRASDKVAGIQRHHVNPSVSFYSSKLTFPMLLTR
jgi:hypothetical protein